MIKNKKIELYEKILNTVEMVVSLERQTGFIKSMLEDKEEVKTVETK